jgi:hypothetical protein
VKNYLSITLKVICAFFLSAITDFNPCFTDYVYQGVFTEMFTVSCLQRRLQFIPFYHLSIEYRSVFGRYVGVLTNLISLGIFLKCLEDTSEEVCDADGVLCGTAEPEVGERFEN